MQLLDEPVLTEGFPMPAKRSVRRHHRQRMIRHAVRVAKAHLRPGEMAEDVLIDQATRRADHMQMCSCAACGNPRNNAWASNADRLTMAERRSELDRAEGVDDPLIEMEVG